MNIHLNDIPNLPLVAVLVNSNDKIIAHTPEWKEISDMAISYPIRQQRLIVNPMEVSHAPKEAKFAMNALLQQIMDASNQETDPFKTQLIMLALGLDMIIGSMPKEKGTIDDLINYSRIGIAARVGEEPEIEALSTTNLPCDNPSSLALLLVQLAVNASVHGQARDIKLIVHNAKRMAIEWTGTSPGKILKPSRTDLDLEHWGLSFAQLVADSLGGKIYPPRLVTPQRVRTALEIDINRVIMPLALLSKTHMIEQASGAFTDETGWSVNDAVASSIWTSLITAAQDSPGKLIYHNNRAARAINNGQKIWLSLPPTNLEYKIDTTLRGLDHEAALWSSINKNNSIKIRALSKITQWLRTGVPPLTTRSYWLNHWKKTTQIMGLDNVAPQIYSNEIIDVLVSTWLLQEFGLGFEVNGPNVWIVGKRHINNPIWNILSQNNKLAIAGPNIYTRQDVTIAETKITPQQITKKKQDPWE